MSDKPTFLVLNFGLQICNPYMHGFKERPAVPPGTPPTPPTANSIMAENVMEEDEARKFVEMLAARTMNQKFYLLEIKGSAEAKPPVNWT